MVKITKAKLKISNDGVFAIVGKGMYGEDKNVLIDDYSLIGYVKICSDWFEIKYRNKEYCVYWRNLSDNPSIPTRKLYKSVDTDNVLFFLCDLVAEVAFDGARSNGLPHDATIERLKEKYSACEKYYKGISLKYVGSQILLNYR